MDGFAYLPGKEPQKAAPLARYLPPMPDGIVSAFLDQHSGPGGWVLDPFGAAPASAVEMARLGWRVLVAVNNPVGRFLLDAAAAPPSQAHLQAALAELASARKGEERLETHLQSLYLTECTRCHREVPAEAFIWDRESGSLTGRIYRCACGDSGEYPATEADQARAAGFAATDSLHRSRALERVAAPQDPDRLHVQAALECYLPRAVYALVTIINKLESFSLPPELRRALLALVLTACDEANSLWPHPAERPRPKQLTLPSHFLEKNVWRSLERSVEFWANAGQAVQVENWPVLPGDAGGLCLFAGPMRDLAPRMKDLPLEAVVTVLPRPNQAFWTLSELWAGWLWGREAAVQFKSALHRRRYDWKWHAAALYATLKNLSERLPPKAPLFAILPEPEPFFLTAALLAAAGSGFELTGLALRTRHDPAEILWQRDTGNRAARDPAAIDAKSVGTAMVSALQERGEPVPSLHLHAAGLISMAENHSIGWRPEALVQINTPIQAALAGPDFVHHAGSRKPEIGLWGLANLETAGDPLPDRVEIAIVRFLIKNPGKGLPELEAVLNAEFPGLLTPSLGLLHAVLASYALETDGRWSLRPEDSPSSRRTDLEAAAQALSTLAIRLGFSLQRQEDPRRLLLWQDSGQTVYAFTLLASAVAGRILRQGPTESEHNLLVLPGGRAGLLAYKLERDPDLKAAAQLWRMLKFRTLRQLAGMSVMTRQRFEEEISGDPIEPPAQMKLF